MIVCHCKGLTDKDILRRTDHARPGGAREHGEGRTACGGCRPLVRELLRARAARGADSRHPVERPVS
jgi:bacterioferritin-associated ferredoxin